MPPVLVPLLTLVAAAAVGISCPVPWRVTLWLLPPLVVVAAVAWYRRADVVAVASVVAGFGLAGAALGAFATERAVETTLRALLDRQFGGFLLETQGPQGPHDPIRTRLRLTEDATPGLDVTTVRADVLAARIDDQWIPVTGGIILSVGGRPWPAQIDAWRRGRTIEAPITFRRPARFLDAGVADFERQSALDGTTLLASLKSGLLADLVERGSVFSETAARMRAGVRERVWRRVAGYSTESAALVTAVLIGDRGGLSDEVRRRLQAAGTYHVVAISGGNIAVLVVVVVLAVRLLGASGRGAACVALVTLAGYVGVVTAGPSVWRATLVAGTHLGARACDHRTSSWQATTVAAALLVCARPLEVRNAGFLLTFGATVALLEVARRASDETRVHGLVGRAAWWCVMSVAASAAVEATLLPVMASVFGRVTLAGILLNLVAVPLMTVVQMAGMVLLCVDRIDAIAHPTALVAHMAASGIVRSSELLDAAPWLTWRVPVPSMVAITCYYASLGLVVAAHHARVRALGYLCFFVAGLSMCLGLRPPLTSSLDADHLRLTMVDVGQGEAMALEVPGGRGAAVSHVTMMVDTGGSPFGSAGFDIGARVVEPALWAAGIRSLAALVLTHGDPDHIGGASALIDDFRPGTLWQGIPVRRAMALQAVLARAANARVQVRQRRARESFALGAARVVVLHPEAPDWERPRVRNDDSVVMEVIFGDVALLLTGDVGSDVERDLIPRLVPAKTRILKVGHHGSRTSTSAALLEAWRPHVALISCGRGNAFGHPAPDVIERLTAAGAAIYRTDRDGEITVTTDGRDVRVTTFAGGRPSRP